MKSGMFAALAGRNYRIWAIGAAVSNIGTWMQRTAQGWLVLTVLTHEDATALGVVTGLQFAPQILFLPWIGALADRFDRRTILIITQALMGVLALALGALVATGCARLWEVDLFAFLFGTASAFDAPARQSFVADLAGDADLANAVALNSVSFNAARMIGPAVAGLCIAHAGIDLAFLFNGISFFAVLAALLCLRRRDLIAAVKARRGETGLLSGVRYVWQRRDLRAAMMMLAVVGTFGLNFQIYIATMAVRVFHVGPTSFGALNTAMAAGTMIGALGIAARPRASLGGMVWGAGLFAVGCVLSAVAPGFASFALVLALTGLAAQILTTFSNSFMQLATEPAMRGRVMALRLAVALGGTPVGGPVAGFIANHFGPRASLGAAAVSGVVAMVIGARVALRRG